MAASMRSCIFRNKTHFSAIWQQFSFRSTVIPIYKFISTRQTIDILYINGINRYRRSIVEPCCNVNNRLYSTSTDHVAEETPHSIINNPEQAKPKGYVRRCYNCNEIGHFSRDCTKEILPGACYNCKQPGHSQKDCPEANSCYRCGGTGHIAKDCPEERSCYRCGGTGHIAQNCQQESSCYRCGEKGHLSKNCPQERSCYKCGETGHIAKDCTKDNNPDIRDSRRCFNCGEEGHLSKDCFKERSVGGRE